MMFEVGRHYRITTGVGDDQGYSSYTVTEVDMPLIKAEGAGITTIFNTSAPSFVSAELDDPEARAAAHAKLMERLSPDDASL